jgi:hypothetical protein
MPPGSRSTFSPVAISVCTWDALAPEPGFRPTGMGARANSCGQNCGSYREITHVYRCPKGLRGDDMAHWSAMLYWKFG